MQAEDVLRRDEHFGAELAAAAARVSEFEARLSALQGTVGEPHGVMTEGESADPHLKAVKRMRDKEQSELGRFEGKRRVLLAQREANLLRGIQTLGLMMASSQMEAQGQGARGQGGDGEAPIPSSRDIDCREFANVQSTTINRAMHRSRQSLRPVTSPGPALPWTNPVPPLGAAPSAAPSEAAGGSRVQGPGSEAAGGSRVQGPGSEAAGGGGAAVGGALGVGGVPMPPALTIPGPSEQLLPVQHSAPLSARSQLLPELTQQVCM